MGQTVTESLKIYKDTYLIFKKLILLSDNVSKKIRFSLLNECISSVSKVIDCIYCSYSFKERRYDELSSIIILLGGVRTRIRLMGELQGINIKTQTYLILKIDEIIKQAIAWRKTTTK